MEKQEGKKKIPFQEKMRDYACAHGHYPPPTKADHLREIELLQKQALKRNGAFHKSIFASRSYFIFDYNGVKLKVGSKLTEVQNEEFRHDTYVKAFTNRTFAVFKLSEEDNAFLISSSTDETPIVSIVDTLNQWLSLLLKHVVERNCNRHF